MSSTKQAISRRGKNENGSEMCKRKITRARRENYCFSLPNTEICDVVVAVNVVVAWSPYLMHLQVTSGLTAQIVEQLKS